MSSAKLAVALILSACLGSSRLNGEQRSISPETEHLVVSSSAEAATELSEGAAYVQPMPTIKTKKQSEDRYKPRPFSTVAVALKVNTSGAGVELATPLARRFNLRAGVSGINFGYGFNVDGVDYQSRFRLRSGQMSVDWFPTRHGFHISPGLLYFNHKLSAVSSVPPGGHFELGDQGFTNSVNDPVNGTAKLNFPRNYAPLLMIGFGNLIPRSGRHLSFPVDVGAAYTGPASIDVTLNGTACVEQYCFSFAQNKEAQDSLKQEIADINEKIKRVPVYPLVSFGVAYRF
jgi:hypothetical protein